MSNDAATTQPRQPDGTPAGGQFAGIAHAEPAVSLTPQPVVTASSANPGRLGCPFCGSSLDAEMEEAGRGYESYRVLAAMYCEDAACGAVLAPSGEVLLDPVWVRHPDTCQRPAVPTIVHLPVDDAALHGDVSARIERHLQDKWHLGRCGCDATSATGACASFGPRWRDEVPVTVEGVLEAMRTVFASDGTSGSDEHGLLRRQHHAVGQPVLSDWEWARIQRARAAGA